MVAGCRIKIKNFLYTHTYALTALFLGLPNTQVSRYQKGR